MDHKERHHQQHKKEREHEDKLKKERDHLEEKLTPPRSSGLVYSGGYRAHHFDRARLDDDLTGAK